MVDRRPPGLARISGRARFRAVGRHSAVRGHPRRAPSPTRAGTSQPRSRPDRRPSRLLTSLLGPPV